MFLHKLEPLHLSQNQDLFLYEQYAQEVYFVFSGKIVFKNVDGLSFVRFLPGSMFGEVEILFETLRYCSAQAQVVSNLLFVNKKNFQILLDTFPKVRQELRKLARQKAVRHEEAMANIVDGHAKTKFVFSEFRNSTNQSVVESRLKRVPTQINERESKDRHQLQRLSTVVMSECGGDSHIRRSRLSKARTGNQPGVSQLFDTSMKDMMKSEYLQRNEESLEKSQQISRIIENKVVEESSKHLDFSREFRQIKPKVNLKKNQDLIEKLAKQQLKKAESMKLTIEEDSFMKDFKLTKGKVSKHESSNLGAILKQESKLILAEREGKIASNEASQSSRKDLVKSVKRDDFYSATVSDRKPIPQEISEVTQRIPEEAETGFSSPYPPYIVLVPQQERIRTASRLERRLEEIKNNEFNPQEVLGAFNQTMRMLQEKTGQILGVFNTLGSQHEKIVSEIQTMKQGLKEYAEKEVRRHQEWI